MGVYIKNMTLDEFSEYGDDCLTLIGIGQADEVPPHGRLIDADVLFEEIYKLRMWLLENNMPGAENWVTKAYQVVDELPTIIEAEIEE